MVQSDRIERASKIFPPRVTDISSYQNKLTEIVRHEKIDELKVFEAALIAEIITLARENTPASLIKLHRIEKMVDEKLKRPLSHAKNLLFAAVYNSIKGALSAARTLQ